MATTTLHTIFDRWVTDIIAIVPYQHSDKLFDRCPKHRRLRTWATDASNAFRRFEIRRTGAVVPVTLTHLPTERMLEETAMITVAYPVSLKQIYRTGAVPDDALDMDDMIRRDANDISNVVFSYENYLTGQHGAWPTIEAPDLSDEHVTFQDITVRVIYSEALAL